MTAIEARQFQVNDGPLQDGLAFLDTETGLFRYTLPEPTAAPGFLRVVAEDALGRSAEAEIGIVPPDVVDALPFTSPTPFSVWGVIAMWAIFAAALLAGLRRRLRLPPRAWRQGHTALAAVIVLGTVVHAMLIEGTMETVSKAALGVLALAAAPSIR